MTAVKKHVCEKRADERGWVVDPIVPPPDGAPRILHVYGELTRSNEPLQPFPLGRDAVGRLGQDLIF